MNEMTHMQSSAYPVDSTQQMLRTLSKSGTEIPLVVPSGVYDNDTQAAVQQFQQMNGLPVTGQMDADTWRKLRSEAQMANIRYAQAAPLNIVLQPNQMIHSGACNRHLYLIQAMLMALGDCFSGVPSVSATGVLDQSTQDALCWIQKHADQPETGEMDRLTWLLLTLLYRAAVQDGT